MNEKYKSAFDLINEGKHEEAYTFFTNRLEQDSKDYFARFYRAILAFSYLPDKMEETIEDLETLANIKNKFTNLSKAYLCIIYSNIEIPNKAIEYGESAVISTDEGIEDILIDVYYSLSKAYMMLGDIDSLEMALKCTDVCLEKEPDEISELYINKVDILSRMNKFDEAESVLSTYYVKFGSSFSYYYISSELNILIYNARGDKEYLDKALNDVIIALQYEPKSKILSTLKAKIHAMRNETSLALNTIDEIKDEFTQEDLLIEKFNIYEIVEDFDSIIDLASNYLKDNESWKIYYSLAFVKAKFAVTKEEINEVRDLYLKSYNITKKIFVFNELYRINYVLCEDEKNIELVEDLLKISPKDGRLYYLLAEAKHRLNYDYDEVLKCFEEAQKLEYLDELRYYTMITPLVVKPSKYHKYLRKYRNVDPSLISPWMARKIGIRYLYGEEGYTKDLKKARLYLEHAFNNLSDESCMCSTYGRLLEIEGKNEEAFNMYLKAYEMQKDDAIAECNCANGYLAHAYINGIGTDVDLDMAKKLILEGVDVLGDKSSNIVIYLYAYFTLLEEEGFDLNIAKSLLELKYPFYRYEISRPMMLQRIYKKLGLDPKVLDDIIWDCRWKGDSFNSKYYFRNRKKDIIYPSFNNY